eukprot:6684037-Pyramimonas_sp.AAC.1
MHPGSGILVQADLVQLPFCPQSNHTHTRENTWLAGPFFSVPWDGGPESALDRVVRGCSRPQHQRTH